VTITLSDLPFGLDVSLPCELDRETEVDVTLQTLQRSAWAEDASLRPAEELIHLFAIAGAEQMFMTENAAHRTSRLDIVDQQSGSESLVWQFRYRTCGVQTGAFLILVSLLAQARFAYSPIAHVSLTARHFGRQWVDAPGLLAMAPDVPVRVSPLPFTLTHHEARSERRTISFTFRNRVSRSLFEKMREPLNIWDHLVVFGGFRFDFEEQEFLPSFGESVHLSPYVVQHRIDFLDGSESALNALLNFAVRMNTDGHALECVEID